MEAENLMENIVEHLFPLFITTAPPSGRSSAAFVHCCWQRAPFFSMWDAICTPKDWFWYISLKESIFLACVDRPALVSGHQFCNVACLLATPNNDAAVAAMVGKGKGEKFRVYKKVPICCHIIPIRCENKMLFSNSKSTDQHNVAIHQPKELRVDAGTHAI